MSTTTANPEGSLLDQAANKAAPRRFLVQPAAPSAFASLDDRNGDDTVDVQRIAHDGSAQFAATFKGDPEGLHGYGICVSEAIDDLYSMQEAWNEEQRERASERASGGVGFGAWGTR